jgi:glycosyltransferase involved in cell wall biosynthesis
LCFSTSREESLGLAMMEAIYLGKPVIALNSGGSNLIITESNGFVIDSFDGVKIAEVLRDFVEVKLSDFKDKVSVEILDNFDLESEFIRWENLLKKIAL